MKFHSSERHLNSLIRRGQAQKNLQILQGKFQKDFTRGMRPAYSLKLDKVHMTIGLGFARRIRFP
jgi:hypothetical protein